MHLKHLGEAFKTPHAHFWGRMHASVVFEKFPVDFHGQPGLRPAAHTASETRSYLKVNLLRAIGYCRYRVLTISSNGLNFSVYLF